MYQGPTSSSRRVDQARDQMAPCIRSRRRRSSRPTPGDPRRDYRRGQDTSQADDTRPHESNASRPGSMSWVSERRHLFGRNDLPCKIGRVPRTSGQPILAAQPQNGLIEQILRNRGVTPVRHFLRRLAENRFSRLETLSKPGHVWGWQQSQWCPPPVFDPWSPAIPGVRLPRNASNGSSCFLRLRPE